MPSKSNLYGLLDKTTVASAEKFGIACAKGLKKEGIFKGRTVNLDGHLISYFGDLKLVNVFDKWFSVGSLLEYRDKKMNLKYVTLIKLYDNRIEEMKSIPKAEFEPLVGTDRELL